MLRWLVYRFTLFIWLAVDILLTEAKQQVILLLLPKYNTFSFHPKDLISYYEAARVLRPPVEAFVLLLPVLHVCVVGT